MATNHSTDGKDAPSAQPRSTGSEHVGNTSDGVLHSRRDEQPATVERDLATVAAVPGALPEPATESEAADSMPPPAADETYGVPIFPHESPAWATFGKQGRVSPVPGRITEQSVSRWIPVPDTAMEWADLKGLSFRGVSIRGHVHRHEGSARQDHLAIGERDDMFVFAVADGVGSEPESHLGSALAARRAVWQLPLTTLRKARPLHFDCKPISDLLQIAASQRGLAPKSLSTTLTFAVVDRTPTPGPDGGHSWHVSVAQIGDSHAYLLRSGVWTRVTVSDRDASSADLPSNVVEPLPKHSLARVWHLDVQTGDVLALTTDGVGNLLEDEPAFKQALSYHWKAHAPSLPVLLYVLDAAVKSYDDDRTFLAIRFAEAS